ncbi:MAG: metalloregulator ArsR/SmtB family transcription factor [Pseudomonadota bacterium]
MTYDKTMQALAEPTRRALVERLREGPLSVADLARGMEVSRPAVSQHLRVLSDAGLLEVTPVGTRRLYRLCPDAIAALRSYLDCLWEDAFAAFEAEAYRQKGPPNGD